MVPKIIKLTRDNAARSSTWINFQHVLSFEESGNGGTVIFLTSEKAIKILVTESPLTIEKMLS